MEIGIKFGGAGVYWGGVGCFQEGEGQIFGWGGNSNLGLASITPSKNNPVLQANLRKIRTRTFVYNVEPQLTSKDA